MKALIFKKYGSPDQLQLAEIGMPVPGADEVLIKVAATAVNQADLHVLSGGLRFSTGILRPRQRILGSDIAGRVTAVGAQVTEFHVGDWVFGDTSAHGRGGFAEYVTAPADAFASMPAGLTPAEAAAVPMTGVTALQGVRDHGALLPGERVLINGASGGVGSFAVQIAKLLGGEVTAVASSRKVDLVRRIGADRVIDYTQTDFTHEETAYDLIFDTVANHSVAAIKRVLRPGGRYISAAFSISAQLHGGRLRRREGKTMRNMFAKPRRADLVYLGELVAAGKIRPLIDRCFPLAEGAAALAWLGDGRGAGKVLVQTAAGNSN